MRAFIQLKSSISNPSIPHILPWKWQFYCCCFQIKWIMKERRMHKIMININDDISLKDLFDKSWRVPSFKPPRPFTLLTLQNLESNLLIISILIRLTSPLNKSAGFSVSVHPFFWWGRLQKIRSGDSQHLWMKHSSLFFSSIWGSSSFVCWLPRRKVRSESWLGSWSERTTNWVDANSTIGTHFTKNIIWRPERKTISTEKCWH